MVLCLELGCSSKAPDLFMTPVGKVSKLYIICVPVKSPSTEQHETEIGGGLYQHVVEKQ